MRKCIYMIIHQQILDTELRRQGAPVVYHCTEISSNCELSCVCE